RKAALHPAGGRGQRLGRARAAVRPEAREPVDRPARGGRPPHRTRLGGRLPQGGDGGEPAQGRRVRGRLQGRAGPLRPRPGRRPGDPRREPAAADRRPRPGADALPLRRPGHRHRGLAAADRRTLVPGGFPAPRRGRRGRRHGGRSAIMPAMPTHPPLPFGDLPAPPSPGAPGDAPPPPAPPRPPASRAPVRPPWWSRLLGGLLAPWIGLKIQPEEGPGSDGRPVCYVLEDYGLSNALILDRACRQVGMPSPLRPLPGDPLGRKRAYVALSRRNAGSTL